jgi:phosphotriesterase-related protein
MANNRQSRDEIRGKVQTVNGLIAPETLGKTLLHEHILVDIRMPVWKCQEQVGETITLDNRFAIDYCEITAPGNYLLNKTDVAIDELRKMYDVGGRTVVDVSCGGLHPNPVELKKISQKSGVNIVLGCGYYVDEYQDIKNHDKSIHDFTQEIIDQIQFGAWGTEIRAGIIGEIGCQSPWTDLEKRVMFAAIQAQSHTGAALSIHPGRDPDQPIEVANFLKKENADLNRAIMSHVDRTIFDDDRLFALADTGIVVEFDLFGMESSFYKYNLDVDMPNDAVRLRSIRSLIERGHLHQIAISHDICSKTRLGCNGGHGYGHIFRNIVPMMLRRGFNEDEIDTILVQTPKRLLTIV